MMKDGGDASPSIEFRAEVGDRGSAIRKKERFLRESKARARALKAHEGRRILVERLHLRQDKRLRRLQQRFFKNQDFAHLAPSKISAKSTIHARVGCAAQGCSAAAA